MKLTVETKCIVTKGGKKGAAIGSMYSDEAGLSMCVISHVHSGQPPGTHTHTFCLSK